MADTEKSLVQVLRSTVVELLDSKKFVTSFTAAMAALLVTYLAKKGIAIDAETGHEFIKIIMGGVAAFVVSQGVADHGKESVKADQHKE